MNSDRVVMITNKDLYTMVGAYLTKYHNLKSSDGIIIRCRYNHSSKDMIRCTKKMDSFDIRFPLEVHIYEH